jgi:hypothetical protein
VVRTDESTGPPVPAAPTSAEVGCQARQAQNDIQASNAVECGNVSRQWLHEPRCNMRRLSHGRAGEAIGECLQARRRRR